MQTAQHFYTKYTLEIWKAADSKAYRHTTKATDSSAHTHIYNIQKPLTTHCFILHKNLAH